MSEKIRVFVSSDQHELKPERKTAKTAISELLLEAVLFEDIPASSHSPDDEFTKAVRTCHIFALIVWKSFRESVNREYQEAVSLAKPILMFVKTLKDGEQVTNELTLFLEGAKRRTVFYPFRKLSELSRSFKEGLMGELSKSYEIRSPTQSRREVYELGRDIIRHAQRRLYIVQRTPVLFLGARGYLAATGEKFDYEQKFLTELEDWIKSASKDKGKELLYMFSPASTVKELKPIRLLGPNFADQVATRITKYKEIEKTSNARLRFEPIRSEFSGPMIVGDNRFAIWILDTDKAVALSHENDALATSLARLLDGSGESHISADKILKELGLPRP